MATFMLLLLVFIGGLIVGIVGVNMEINYIIITIAYVLSVSVLAAFLTLMGFL